MTNRLLRFVALLFLAPVPSWRKPRQGMYGWRSTLPAPSTALARCTGPKSRSTTSRHLRLYQSRLHGGGGVTFEVGRSRGLAQKGSNGRDAGPVVTFPFTIRNVDKLNRYMNMGIRAFIFSGYPLLNETDWFARLVLSHLPSVTLSQLQGRTYCLC